MRGDHADYSGAPNRGCVRARAIFPCCNRDPDFTLSFERFLWSACLPSSLARDITKPTFPCTALKRDRRRYPPLDRDKDRDKDRDRDRDKGRDKDRQTDRQTDRQNRHN